MADLLSFATCCDPYYAWCMWAPHRPALLPIVCVQAWFGPAAAATHTSVTYHGLGSNLCGLAHPDTGPAFKIEIAGAAFTGSQLFSQM